MSATPATLTPAAVPAVAESTTPAVAATNTATKRKADDAGLDSRAVAETTTPAASVAAATRGLSDEDVARIVNALKSSNVAPVPTTATQQPAKTEPVATPTPTTAGVSTDDAGSKRVKLDLNPMHDAIAQVAQMYGQVADKEKEYESIRDIVQDSTQRMRMEQDLADRKAKVAQYAGVIVDAFEKHDAKWRKDFKVPPSVTVSNDIARLKAAVRNQQTLSDDDLRWMGQSLEYITESGAGHERELEAREAQIRENLQRQQQDTFLPHLQRVLGADPRSMDNRGSSVSGGYNSSGRGGMAPPPQRTPAASQQSERQQFTPQQQFQRETGLAWVLVTDQSQIKHRPAPPSGSLADMRNPLTGGRLAPPRVLRDSIFATGLADTEFASYINDARADAVKGTSDLFTLEDLTAPNRAEVQRVFGLVDAAQQMPQL